MHVMGGRKQHLLLWEKCCHCCSALQTSRAVWARSISLHLCCSKMKPCQFTSPCYFVLCFPQIRPSLHNLRKQNNCCRCEGALKAVKKKLFSIFHPKFFSGRLGKTIRTYLPSTTTVLFTDHLRFHMKVTHMPGEFLKEYLRVDRNNFLVILTLDWDDFPSIIGAGQGSTHGPWCKHTANRLTFRWSQSGT